MRGPLAKPGEDRLRAHDLAAGPAFLGGQQLTLERQSAPLLDAQIDPNLAGRRSKDLLENPNLLLQVVDSPCHPVVDRIRDHRDDELERRWDHRIGPRLRAPCRFFKPAVCRGIVRESAAMGFWTARDREPSACAWARSKSREVVCTPHAR